MSMMPRENIEWEESPSNKAISESYIIPGSRSRTIPLDKIITKINSYNQQPYYIIILVIAQLWIHPTNTKEFRSNNGPCLENMYLKIQVKKSVRTKYS